MENYRDWDNDSGIEAYEIENDAIIIQFKNGRNKFYKYTNFSCGSDNIAIMKQLACEGEGLNEFIVENKIEYESKW